MEEESWKEESWDRNHGRGVKEEELWERDHGGGIIGHLGGIWRHLEASGRHLGEASERHLEGIHLRFSPLAHREAKTKTEKETYR